MIGQILNSISHKAALFVLSELFSGDQAAFLWYHKMIPLTLGQHNVKISFF